MKKGLLVILILVPLLTGFRIEDRNSDRKDFPIGYIDITVESNASRLFFKYDLSERCLTVVDDLLTEKEKDTTAYYVIVPVKDFQCTNSLIYRDFLTLLKANQYPFMKIAIPRRSFFQIQANNSVILRGVMITIAGVSRAYDIICKIDRQDSHNDILIGTTRIRLTDLEIEPPVKFLGMVKIKDEIIVNFGFCLRDEGTNILLSDH